MAVSRFFHSLPKYHAEKVRATRDACFAQLVADDGEIANAEKRVLQPLLSLLESRLWPTENERRRLVHLVLDIAEKGEKDYKLLATCFRTLSALLRSFHLLPQDVVGGLEIDASKMLAIADRLWFSKTREMPDPIRTSDVHIHFGHAAMKMSSYWVQDSEKIWKHLRPKICPHLHSGMLTAMSVLLAMMPTRGITQEQLDDLIDLWPLSTNMMWTNEIVSFLARVAADEVTPGSLPPPKCSVLPHAATIYQRVVKGLMWGTNSTAESHVVLSTDKYHKKDKLAWKGGNLLASLAKLQFDAHGDLSHLDTLLRFGNTFNGTCDDKRDILVHSIAQSVVYMVKDKARILLGRPLTVLCHENEEEEEYFTDNLPPSGLDDSDGSTPSQGDAADEGKELDSLPYPEFRKAMASRLLPRALAMLINVSNSHVSSSGAKTCATLIQLDKDTALPKVVERLRLMDSITTGSFGKNAVTLEAVLPAVMLHGSDEDKEWLLTKTAEMLDASSTSSMTQLMRCVIFITSLVPLDTPLLEKWGEDVFNRMLKLAETIELSEAPVTTAFELLLLAMSDGLREKACCQMRDVILTTVHNPVATIKVNDKMKFMSLFTRACALASPEWGEKIAGELQKIIRDELDTNTSRLQWYTNLLAWMSPALGPRLVPLSAGNVELAKALMATDDGKAWRVKAGGQLLEHTLHGLLSFSPKRYPPGAVNLFASRITWHSPSDEELECAVNIINEWFSAGLLADVSSWNEENFLRLRRLKYVMLGARVLFHEQLAAPEDPFARGLTNDRRGAALRKLKVQVVDVIRFISTCPVETKALFNDKVGEVLAVVIKAVLLSDGMVQKRLLDVPANALRSMSGLYFGRKVLRPAAAFMAAAHWSNFLAMMSRMKTRGADELQLLQRAVSLGVKGFEKTRSLCTAIIHAVINVYALPPECFTEMVKGCTEVLQRAPCDMPLEEEEPVKGALQMLNHSDFMLHIWRNWGLCCETMLAVARMGTFSGLKEDVVKAVEGVLTTALTTPQVSSLQPGTGAAEVRDGLDRLVAASSPQMSTHILRVLAVLSPMVSSVDHIPDSLLVHAVHGLTDDVSTARASSRTVLSRLMLRFKPAIPYELVPTTDECTTTTAHPTYNKRYTGPPVPPHKDAKAVMLPLFTPSLLESILDVDELREGPALTEGAREEKCAFKFSTAQMWKGLFQVLGEDLIAAVERCRIRVRDYNAQSIAEMVGGLLRAIRYFEAAGNAKAVEMGWKYSLQMLDKAVETSEMSIFKEFKEMLCFASTGQDKLGPLNDYLTERLVSSTSTVKQARALELIGRYIGGMHKTKAHLDFVYHLIDTLSSIRLRLEYEQIRQQLVGLCAYLCHMLFSMNGAEDPKLSAFLIKVTPPEDENGAKVLLGSVSSVSSLGRVVSLIPYFPIMITALSFLTKMEMKHADDGEVVRAIMMAIQGFFQASMSGKDLVAMLPQIPNDLLVKNRGQVLLNRVLSILFSNVFTDMQDPEVLSVFKPIMYSQLQSSMIDASKNAANLVATVSRVCREDFTEELLADFLKWKTDEKSSMRKAAATGLGGLTLANSSNPTEFTWKALEPLIELSADKAADVGRRASEFAARWRQIVKEHPILWKIVLPDLEQKGLTQKLLAVPGASQTSVFS